MARALTSGAYDHLALVGDEILEGLEAIQAALEGETAHRAVSRYVAKAAERALLALPTEGRAASAADLANLLIEVISKQVPRSGLGAGDQIRIPPEMLRAVHAPPPVGRPPVVPLTPLSETVLFTNAPGEPGVGSEIARELDSADRVDALVAFVKWSGIRLIEDQLQAYLNSGRQLRIITTTYTGATERTALDRLVRMGATVKVSYDNQSTRLHAKAWLFHRNNGFDTAWVGSSNLSRAALVDGLEWNVRASRVTTPDLIDKFAATFDAYWADEHFETYRPDQDTDRFDQAVGAARNEVPIDFSFLDVRPYPFQQQMLDQLQVERERHGRWRNLVVAATGTGKTVVAALDYARLKESLPRARLLFVAHRREILDQSRRMFRLVLRDASFGETYVDGTRPERRDHLFASIQSLSALDPTTIPADHFDVVIVDEFHHAAANTYRALLEHVRPTVLLGLTATPERADGQDVSIWFEGRYAVELRLWSAVDLSLLVPFHYFGIADDVDLSGLRWARGGYQLADLDGLYTGNDARVARVLEAIRDKIGDPRDMRAIGFCVSVAHAEYMARRFNEAGIPSIAVSASTPTEPRQQALRDLRDKEINVLFAVDLFNEGVDVPQVDTVLFLRPTESATVFLQQLGRGLRHSPGKAVLTALDFVGNQNRRFRFDLKYRALTGGSRQQVVHQIETGFPFLPSGCHVELDRVAQKLVLDHIKSSLPNRWPERVSELKAMGDVDLAFYLESTGLEVDDVYQGGRSWTEHRRAAGWVEDAPGSDEVKLGRALGRMIHLGDSIRLNYYRKLLRREHISQPAAGSVEWKLQFMLHTSLWGIDSPGSLEEGWGRLRAEPHMHNELLELLELLEARADRLEVKPRVPEGSPLRVHARYTRDEALAAMGIGTPEKPPSLREGVKWDEGSKCDIFLFTLDKSDEDFAPSVRYNDYAISPDLFHWESQSTTSEASATGQRYIHHRERGTHILLFARETKKTIGGRSLPYMFLGPASYVDHRGERPIAITWKLDHPLPADFYTHAKIAAG